MSSSSTAIWVRSPFWRTAITRSTASRRARNSASVRIGARRRRGVAAVAAALALGLEPGRALDAAHAVVVTACGSRTWTTVLAGRRAVSSPRRRTRRRRRSRDGGRPALGLGGASAVSARRRVAASRRQRRRPPSRWRRRRRRRCGRRRVHGVPGGAGGGRRWLARSAASRTSSGSAVTSSRSASVSAPWFSVAGLSAAVAGDGARRRARAGPRTRWRSPGGSRRSRRPAARFRARLRAGFAAGSASVAGAVGGRRLDAAGLGGLLRRPFRSAAFSAGLSRRLFRGAELRAGAAAAGRAGGFRCRLRGRGRRPARLLRRRLARGALRAAPRPRRGGARLRSARRRRSPRPLRRLARSCGGGRRLRGVRARCRGGCVRRGCGVVGFEHVLGHSVSASGRGSPRCERDRTEAVVAGPGRVGADPRSLLRAPVGRPGGWCGGATTARADFGRDQRIPDHPVVVERSLRQAHRYGRRNRGETGDVAQSSYNIIGSNGRDHLSNDHVHYRTRPRGARARPRRRPSLRTIAARTSTVRRPPFVSRSTVDSAVPGRCRRRRASFSPNPGSSIRHARPSCARRANRARRRRPRRCPGRRAGPVEDGPQLVDVDGRGPVRSPGTRPRWPPRSGMRRRS